MFDCLKQSWEPTFLTNYVFLFVFRLVKAPHCRKISSFSRRDSPQTARLSCGARTLCECVLGRTRSFEFQPQVIFSCPELKRFTIFDSWMIARCFFVDRHIYNLHLQGIENIRKSEVKKSPIENNFRKIVYKCSTSSFPCEHQIS